MTWTPENNETITGILAAEHPERLEALQAAKHGWCFYQPMDGEWVDTDEPTWSAGTVYRAKPAPKWEPPAELWALLRPEIVAIAKIDDGYWYGYEDGEAISKIWEVEVIGGEDCDISLKDDEVHDISALNLPDIPWEESLFIRPGRE